MAGSGRFVRIALMMENGRTILVLRMNNELNDNRNYAPVARRIHRSCATLAGRPPATSLLLYDVPEGFTAMTSPETVRSTRPSGHSAFGPGTELLAN